MQNIIKKIIKIVFYLNLCSLLLSYASVYISPDSFWPIAFFGLAFPFILFVQIVFLIFWLITRRKKMILISLAIIFVGIPWITDFVQLSPFGTNPKEGELGFKLLSYNVRNFDLYNWSNNSKTKEKILDYIVQENADILCFQEFCKVSNGQFPTVYAIIKKQKAKNVHDSYQVSAVHMYYFGIATFCKYPIIYKGEIKFKGSNNICLFTDFVKETDTIRIYNCHLESIRFISENYNFLDSLSISLGNDQITGAKNILKKLKSAFVKRSKQADQIAEHIRQSPYPVIVCGDFNDTPISYSYHTILGDLHDAFTETGNGVGNTYAGKFPSFRIDYILHDDHFSAFELNTDKNDLSDHYPIHAVIYVNSDKED